MHCKSLTGFVTDLYAQTQIYNIIAQLCFGLRYFDLRIGIVKKKCCAVHGVVSGRTLKKILKHNFLPFLQCMLSEFIIIDIQSVEGPCEAFIEQAFEKHLNLKEWAVPAEKFSTGLTLGEIRKNKWRYVVLWERDQANPYFTKRSKFLDSPYDEPIYKSATDNIIPYLTKCCINWKDDRFLVSQAITTPALRPPISLEKVTGYLFSE